MVSCCILGCPSRTERKTPNITFFTLFCAAVAAAAELPQFYHDVVGVPEATRIKLAEEKAVSGERIVGGWDAWAGEYPYVGGLVITLTSGATSICGSTLLTNTRLVTAARCWWDGRNQARQFTVVLGSTRLYTGGVRLNTRNVEMHTNWNPSTHVNDIAIVTIPSVNYSSEIQPALLPTDASLLLTNTFAGRWGIALGYGRTSDLDGITPYQYLSRVNVQIITNAVCQQSFGVAIVTASSICTSGISGGPCGGDAGGPLVIVVDNQHVLVGVTSFGFFSCEQALPSAYTRVTSYEAWIRLRI